MRKSLFFLLFPFFAAAQGPQYDILITNGKIIDGAGNSWYYGNVAVKNGKIVAIGKSVSGTAKKTIDVVGLIVAPGFIDVHTHLNLFFRSKLPH
jgi:N-acyl-D-amino-acid deacylase